MDVPIEISFREVDHDPALEALIREKAEKLEKVAGHITSLRVAVEQDQKHQRSGQPFRVRLDISAPPGQEFAIRRENSEGHLHKDAPMLVREAFEAARRKLAKIKDKQQGKVKTHPEQEVSALVARVFPEQDYGFLRNLDSRDVYFHRNALTGMELEELKPGMGVRHKETQGDKGLQASVVQVVERTVE